MQSELCSMNFEKYIDHTLLKPMATPTEIDNLCSEAMENKFFSVCVNSSYVALAKNRLAGSDVKVCAVVGFPLGAMSREAKVFETQQAIQDGADEIDMVIQIGFLKAGLYDKTGDEISAVKKAGGDKILKVIIETCYLSEAEKIKACEIAADAGADFVKTSTGFGTSGATLEDVRLMVKAVQGKAKVKASGGIRSREMAAEFIAAGAERLGTSSGIGIAKGETYPIDY